MLNTGNTYTHTDTCTHQNNTHIGIASETGSSAEPNHSNMNYSWLSVRRFVRLWVHNTEQKTGSNSTDGIRRLGICVYVCVCLSRLYAAAERHRQEYTQEQFSILALRYTSTKILSKGRKHRSILAVCMSVCVCATNLYSHIDAH